MSYKPLLITIDVEGIANENNFWSVDRLAELVETLSVPISFFVTPAVARNRSGTISAWLDNGHEVGLHVHPSRFGGESDFLGEYDAPAVAEFLSRGTDVFEKQLNHEPVGFRSGRWSFSNSILEALIGTGFEYDASYRPSGPCDPYVHGDILELPMSVYGNRVVELLLSRYEINGIPLHADAFLRNAVRTVPFYGVTRLVARQDRPYVMVSLHDYDLCRPDVRDRVQRYLARLTEWLPPETLRTVSTGHEQ